MAESRQTEQSLQVVLEHEVVQAQISEIDRKSTRLN